MIAAIPLGIAIGLAVGMVGGGGAVLAVPVLVYLLGEDVHAATTASLLVVAAASLAGAVGQARRGRVCWGPAAGFAVAAAAGSLPGTLANREVGGAALLAAFAVVMLLAASATWRRAGASAEGEGDEWVCPPAPLRHVLPLGFVLGLLTGFFGVGGGFLVVPALAVGLHFALRQAIGTSLVIVTLVSIAGLASHLGTGADLDWALALPFGAATVVGALGGPALSARVPQAALGRGFAALVSAVAVYLLVEAAFLGGPPGA